MMGFLKIANKAWEHIPCAAKQMEALKSPTPEANVPTVLTW